MFSRFFFTAVLIGSLSLNIFARTQITNLRCEYLTNPLGLDTPSPRFTWITESDKSFTQKAYQIYVASAPELLKGGKADIWTSGKMKTSESFAVYNGTTHLASHRKYYWNVEVFGSNGNITSPVATFEMGKMDQKDWSGKWISDNFNREFRKAPMLRKSFSLAKTVKQARVYVCGAGYYELYLNGKKVGDHRLDPGYTAFNKRVLYVTHDVTSLIKNGDNVVAAVLGNGWMNIQSLAVWGFHNAPWRMRPRLLCDLRVEYTDGSFETIVSDSTWKSNTGPYVYNNLYSGDVYDARLEKNGWNDSNYDDKNWTPVQIVEAPAPKIVAQQMPPIRVTKEVKPVEMKTFPDNIYVFNMGENMTGVCRLKVKGEAGTKITIKHGELIHPDGRLNQSNVDVYFQREKNGMALHQDPNETFQTDVYYLKGGNQAEEFTPDFTYHGFQYVEVQSCKPIEITKESLTGLFLHTDVQEAGNFECSDEVLNKIAKASRRSYLCNLFSIPTDCPQREKNGWTADGYISMDLGLLNYDGITVYEKWLNDFVDNQRDKGDISGIVPSAGWGYLDWIGPVWDAGMFIVTNNLYKYYGDKRAVEKIYPTCEKYLEYLKTRETNGILTYGIGDWVFYKAKTPTDYTSTAFYYLDNKLMARFASLIGKDGSNYERKAEELRKIINQRWYNSQTGIYAAGTQAGQAVALALGLADQTEEQKIADKLVEMIRNNNHQLDFGMLGSKFAPSMLTKYGYVEDAYQMITKKEAPSWSNWIEMGLTTLPETWVLDKNFKDASLNHVFLGDVTAWMTNTIAGINYDEQQPGFSHIIIRPHFIKDLTWAKAEYNSVKGLIKSEWKKENGNIYLTVTIPANTTSTLYIDRKVELKSGTYKFTIPVKSKQS